MSPRLFMKFVLVLMTAAAMQVTPVMGMVLIHAGPMAHAGMAPCKMFKVMASDLSAMSQDPEPCCCDADLVCSSMPTTFLSTLAVALPRLQVRIPALADYIPSRDIQPEPHPPRL